MGSLPRVVARLRPGDAGGELGPAPDVELPVDVGLGLSQELFSRVLDVSARSVERWEARPTATIAADTVRRLEVAREILSLAEEIFRGRRANIHDDATPKSWSADAS